MMNKTIRWVLWVVILAFLLLYPRLFGIYFTNVFVTFAIFALFAVSLNLLLGYTGLLSFGHAMYFGTGGYATALALTHIEGLPLLAALLISIEPLIDMARTALNVNGSMTAGVLTGRLLKADVVPQAVVTGDPEPATPD